MSDRTTNNGIDDRAREVAGEILGDEDREATGHEERQQDTDTTAGVGEETVATVVGTAKEAVGRVIGHRDLTLRGRRERRRAHDRRDPDPAGRPS